MTDKKIVDVVSGVIIQRFGNEKRLLLSQRRADQTYPFTWECPGGKVNAGESFCAALHRELNEEIGINLVAKFSSETGELLSPRGHLSEN